MSNFTTKTPQHFTIALLSQMKSYSKSHNCGELIQSKASPSTDTLEACLYVVVQTAVKSYAQTFSGFGTNICLLISRLYMKLKIAEIHRVFAVRLMKEIEM